MTEAAGRAPGGPGARPLSSALLLEGVSKRYSGHLAVDDLSLEIPTGSIYGILGPNGAGKSTTLRMALGIIGRDRGTVRLLGRDPEADREVLRRVGYLPEERGLYRRMRVLDVIVFFARLKGLSAPAARREAQGWLEKLGLEKWRSARLDALSKGMQQKVQFITSIVHSPDLLVLDEPASGLDPINQEVLHQAIREAREDGRTVVFSTHNMDHAEQLCDSVCIIARGRKVLDGPLREVRLRHRGNRWRVELDRPTPEARWALEAMPRYRASPAGPECWEVELESGDDGRGLLAELSRIEARVSRVEHVQPSLHEIFVAQVGEAEEARV